MKWNLESTSDGPIHAVTDVTGFGLLGHAREMAIGSGVSMKINHRKDRVPSGSDRSCARPFFLRWSEEQSRLLRRLRRTSLDEVPEEFRALLFDPQTSGGLLVSIAPDSADSAIAALKRFGVSAQVIGEIIPRRSPLIEIA